MKEIVINGRTLGGSINGIPPLEALACNIPVIVSDIPVMREIYKNSVRYINPNECDVDLDRLITEEVSDSKAVLNNYSCEKTGKQWIGIINEYFGSEK